MQSLVDNKLYPSFIIDWDLFIKELQTWSQNNVEKLSKINNQYAKAVYTV